MINVLNYAFAIKSMDETDGTIEGYASTFGNIDQGGDKMIKGAFKKTLKENKGKFPILDSHRPDKQIGWNLEAHEDDTGLWVKGKLDIKNNATAREKWSLAKTAMEIKADSGLSIGYRPVKWGWDEEEMPDKSGQKVGFRKLQEVKLFEYSMVAFPMNTQSNVTAAKFDDLMRNVQFDGNEEAALEKIVAMMKNHGFNEASIKSALETAAAKLSEPEPLLHLFDEATKNIFK